MAFIPSKRFWQFSFTLRGKVKPDYWDMCVADAVYSVMRRGKDIIYIKDIWAVLSGNRDFKFSKADSDIKKSFPVQGLSFR